MWWLIINHGNRIYTAENKFVFQRPNQGSSMKNNEPLAGSSSLQISLPILPLNSSVGFNEIIHKSDNNGSVEKMHIEDFAVIFIFCWSLVVLGF